MDDRYEIKGKIGQGGLGSVYKAHDIRMNREVAIKRIISNSDDVSISEEATRQLIKEAGALASLQHPNIVTIYDVGTDEDGPFVVMELLTGDTLEALIGGGSFTWPDFRQLAMQSLEALIAAQELHLVHRDLKPSNVMLTWLPSGKFQVKIVDFGLAKLSAAPSLQTIDQSDGVFGSIYFMAPEQFERVPIDLKADLYAIGCVYYYALTGVYPFDGDTAAEVMASHLQHHVTPIQEVREGIPIWVCDWIMWHLNRRPSDRPESARQALKYFVDNDSLNVSSELSTGSPAIVPEQPKRPKLLIPGSAPVPEVVVEPNATQRVKTAAAPKPLLPPDGFKPSVHTTAQVVVQTAEPAPQALAASTSEFSALEPVPPTENNQPVPVAVKAVEENPVPVPVTISTAPMLKRASAASGSKPLTLGTAPASQAIATPTAKPAPETVLAAPSVIATKNQKKGLSNGIKMAIAVVMAILAVGMGVFFLKKSGKNAEAKAYNQMILLAAKDDATEVPVDKRKLEILLRNAVSVSSNTDRYTIYKALFLAKATDGTDIDARIAEFATTVEMIPDVRVVLIRDVLRKRENPAVIGPLLDFAKSTDEPKAAVAAIEASRFMASDVHFPAFLEVLQSTADDLIRKAAEENIATIIAKSSSKSILGQTLTSAYESATNDTVRHSILRLIGRAGGEQALSLVKSNLEGSNEQNRIAAIVALGSWENQDGYKLLLNYLSSVTDITTRDRTFKSAFKFASESMENVQENWTLLAEQAKLEEEQLSLIRGLTNVPPEPWNFAILEGMVANSDSDAAINLAERAIIRLKDIQKIQGENPKDNE